MSDHPDVIERIIEGWVPASQAGTYYLVPFEMPPDVVRLDVAYRYSNQIDSDPHLTGGNTIDIGLFDERGADFLAKGFRGWSGSARSAFFVTPESATPAYLAGPLNPGVWNILLGLYKVAPEGCQYGVTLRFTRDPDRAGRMVDLPRLQLSDAPALIAARPDGWYRGELHCHTQHSDGDSPVEDVIAAAQALDLDFLAIMDHNSLSHLQELAALGPQPIALIPGFEVTTYKGHWNVWGASDWIDFRTLTTPALNAAIELAVQRGYVASCNHPRPYGPPWELADARGYHCVEVWNGPWQLFNSESLAFWETRLRAGDRLVAVGGSDAHRLRSGQEEIARIGTPTTWVYCPTTPAAAAPSPAALLTGLRAGHVTLSARPEGPRLVLTSGSALMGDAVPRPASGQLPIALHILGGDSLTLEVIAAPGCVERQTVRGDDVRLESSIDVTSTPYIRAQLIGPGGAASDTRALTNPLYLDFSLD